MGRWKVKLQLCGQILLLFSVLAISSVSLAADRYVRAGATGANNGSDWTNAYTALPATLVRGDTYYIADGSYAGYTFDDAHSGTTRITIKKANITDHGTAVGWDNTFGDGQAVFSSGLTFTRGFYTVDGVSRTTLTSGHGFKITETVNKGILFDTSGTPDNITVRYVEIQGQLDSGVPNDGIYTLGADDILLQYLHVHHIGRAFVLTRTSNRWTVQYSAFRYNSSDAVQHAECWSDSNSNDFVIRYNVWEDFEGTGCLIALGGAGSPARWKIYGNVFFFSATNPTGRTNFVANGTIAAITGQAGVDWEIYNNTNYNLLGFCTGYNLAYDGGSPSGNIMRNNMWVSNDTANCHGGFATISHNYYSGTTHNTLESNVQSATGVPFVSTANKDFHLTGATTAGFSLSPPYNTDIEGVTRGSGGVWDRGAYEFGGSIAQPSAPMNLRVF